MPGGGRFGDLEAELDGISGEVLTETLRDLDRDGRVPRHVSAEVLVNREAYDAR